MFPIREISEVEFVFPANALEFMPKYEDIPEEFKRNGSLTAWSQLFNDAFFNGVQNLQLIPKEGVDPAKAWRHIRAVMGSYAPKHEHKEAAVAFLLAEWFQSAKWESKRGGLQKINWPEELNDEKREDSP